MLEYPRYPRYLSIIYTNRAGTCVRTRKTNMKYIVDMRDIVDKKWK